MLDVAGASVVAIVACLDAAVLLRDRPAPPPPLLSVLPTPLRSRSPATALYATVALGLVQLAALRYPRGGDVPRRAADAVRDRGSRTGGHSRAAFGSHSSVARSSRCEPPGHWSACCTGT